MTASIAVVVPSHNRPEALIGALASIAAQTSPADEVVVVDDGSQPPVDAALLPGLPGRVRLLRNEPARGANAARNRGWREARAEWVAFLDDDDRFAPEKLARLRQHADGADVLYHAARITMVNEGVSYRTRPADLSRVADPYRELLINNSLGGTPMVMVRREWLERAGGFDEELPSMQDHDLWIRLAQLGARFRLIDQPLTLCRYTTAGGGISTNVDKHFAAAAMIEAKHAAGYADLDRAERTRHQVFVLNVATHRALMAGDAARARALQREVLALTKRPGAVASALVTMLGPRAAFRARSLVSRGPTSSRRQRGD